MGGIEAVALHGEEGRTLGRIAGEDRSVMPGHRHLQAMPLFNKGRSGVQAEADLSYLARRQGRGVSTLKAVIWPLNGIRRLVRALTMNGA
jgi:hypothetical protein